MLVFFSECVVCVVACVSLKKKTLVTEISNGFFSVTLVFGRECRPSSKFFGDSRQGFLLGAPRAETSAVDHPSLRRVVGTIRVIV
jgi:hypothetical protein